MNAVAEPVKTGDVRIRVVHDDCPSDPREDDHLDKMVFWHRRYNMGDKHSYEDNMAMFLDLLDEAPAAVLRPILVAMMKVKSLRQDYINSFRGMSKEDRQSEWHEHISIALEYGPSDADKEVLQAIVDAVAEAASKVVVILPVYMYDHSGIALSTGGFSCPWDSGQLGYIYMTRADVLKETGWPTAEEKASGELTAETIKKVEECLTSIVESYSQYVNGDMWGFIVEKAEVCGHCNDVQWEQEDSCWGFYGTDFDNGMADHIEEKHHELLKAALDNPEHG
jgi:hypothetical protein